MFVFLKLWIHDITFIYALTKRGRINGRFDFDGVTSCN